MLESGDHALLVDFDGHLDDITKDWTNRTLNTKIAELSVISPSGDWLANVWKTEMVLKMDRTFSTCCSAHGREICREEGQVTFSGPFHLVCTWRLKHDLSVLLQECFVLTFLGFQVENHIKR
ncbi:hypothetical protein XENOCAPTIV_011686 [Xenoophorus captivus]|uniref:Uncharacterized protein n=1 Tax=Xenoophorus captivus TaxID=1517983 RepID=A0ABV0QAH4_9TELE